MKISSTRQPLASTSMEETQSKSCKHPFLKIKVASCHSTSHPCIQLLIYRQNISLPNTSIMRILLSLTGLFLEARETLAI